MVDNALYAAMRQQQRFTPTDFHRYLYDKLPYEARLIGITGPRGVGKSTILIQRTIETGEKALYVDADNIYFSNHTLVGLADDFVKENGQVLMIDEIHKYGGWSKELKQIHDTMPELKVIFTGSSVLDIKKGEADLSRRALMYNMQGLSFREYLDLFHGIKLPCYTLQEILAHKVEIEDPQHPLPLFHQYLRNGYFPFSIEPEFDIRLNQMISQTVETDIPLYAGFTAATARKLKQLLGVLSYLAPYKPNFESLSKEVGVSKNTLPEYLAYLEKAGMIYMLRDNTAGMRVLGKVEKLYLDNTNLMYAMAGVRTDIGNVRETFFQNQMRLNHSLRSSRQSDFCIDDYTFEVGGRNKGQKQISGIKNSFIVKDDIEYGNGNIVPLWHFGLTY